MEISGFSDDLGGGGGGGWVVDGSGDDVSSSPAVFISDGTSCCCGGGEGDAFVVASSGVGSAIFVLGARRVFSGKLSLSLLFLLLSLLLLS